MDRLRHRSYAGLMNLQVPPELEAKLTRLDMLILTTTLREDGVPICEDLEGVVAEWTGGTCQADGRPKADAIENVMREPRRRHIRAPVHRLA
jgi:hypothetical protein